MNASRPRLRLLFGLLLAIGACRESGGEVSAPAGGVDPVPSTERERVLGPFLAEHWRLPVAPQGEPPAAYSEAERSLDPATCGACHPKQYAEWSTSLHSAAYSPGLAGQLIEGELAHPSEVRSCQSCHTPLAEQVPFTPALEPNPEFDPELRAMGLPCAGCHVRAHRYFGPPRRADAAPAAEPIPHGGFEVREEYLDSRFCAECHQFFDDPGVNGKPIENTFAEWQQSPQAAAGRQCQDCHMPERAHLWRGIHDPEMVRQAVDVDLVGVDLARDGLVGSLVLLNRDVGHAFPTYVTARVFLAIYQVDANERELPGTRIEGTIGREVDFGLGVEIFDTRVLPGESVRLDYALPLSEGSEGLVGRVTVDPDHHYRGFFDLLRTSFGHPEAREMIEAARRQISGSRYTLTEIHRPLGLPPRAHAAGGGAGD
jgi:hypothetical protein